MSYQKSISSQDENAVEKLQQKLAKLEQDHEFMVRTNREYRKGGITAVTGLDEAAKARAIKEMKNFYGSEKSLIPNYALSNSRQRIAQVKKRLEDLAAEAKAETLGSINGPGYCITEETEDQRIWIQFEAKPEESLRKLLRTYGFKWSPRRQAWIRFANREGRSSARWLIKYLNGLENKDT